MLVIQTGYAWQQSYNLITGLICDFSGCGISATMMLTNESGVWEMPANFPSYDGSVQVTNLCSSLF